MIERIRYTWQLLVIAGSLIITGILLLPATGISLSINYFVINVAVVALINLAAYFIMSLGLQKSNRDGVVILLAGIGGKFLFYLIYILVFWMVTKNLTKPFIIAFFALYLGFTFFLGIHLVKVLKNK